MKFACNLLPFRRILFIKSRVWDPIYSLPASEGVGGNSQIGIPRGSVEAAEQRSLCPYATARMKKMSAQKCPQSYYRLEKKPRY